MRLRHKLLLVNATVAVIAAAVFWLAYAGTQTVLDEYIKITGHNLPTVAALQDLRSTATGIVAGNDELMLLSTLGAAEEGEQRGRAVAFADAAVRYVDLTEGFFEEERDTARDIDRKARELIEVSEAAAAGLLEARQRLEAAEERLLERVSGALAHESEELAQFSERIEGAILRSGRLVALAAAVTLLLTGAGYAVARAIIRPIDRLTRATACVAAGEAVELEAPCSHHELGELVAAFRKMAEDLAAARGRAEEAGRAKEDFLAAMSHEIRTPLTGVLGMADLLAAEELVGRQRDYVEAIRTSGRHLLSSINDVLDFSRIEAGRLELDRIDFSVLSTLERVRSIMAPQAVERGLTLEFEVAAHTPTAVRGDPTRLKQVLLNLVGTALKFTHEGGIAVAVRHEPAGGRAVLFRFEVRDTGIGLPEERRVGLFEAFAQADSSTTRRYGSSGLGLAICRRLVEAMNGRIGVDDAPKLGSLFWFEVPFEPGDAVAAAEKADPAPALIPPLRVLVAEDVSINRDLLADVLGRHGHEAVLAENGGEAVELAGRGRFDLVLMDVQMPVMDGLEATRRIRRLLPPAGGVPIMALTASVMESERERCLAAGMDRVMTKPVAWPELFTAMAELTQRRGAGEDTPIADEEEALLDQGMLAVLEKDLGPEALAGFLGRAVAEAERAHGELERLLDRPEEGRRVAHRLRGTAGGFGLARVSELAGMIEERARRGEGVADLVARLGEAVAATREEVGRARPA